MPKSLPTLDNKEEAEIGAAAFHVAERPLALSAAGDFEEIAELYPPDATAELHFAPLVLRGREAIYEHFHRFASAPLMIELMWGEIVPTGLPSFLIVRSRYRLRGSATGQEAECENLHLIDVDDRKITRSVDYHEHRVFREVCAPMAPTGTDQALFR